MHAEVNPKIEAGWKSRLLPAFQAESFHKLKAFLLAERERRETIFPPASRIFAAFDHTPWDQVRVVIIGQDPYHGHGQANGLCFSVADGVPHPPSLQNMFKELRDDLGLPIPRSGDLSPWARQGVLLLNATLTVRAHQAGSHQNQGWEPFTDEVIRQVNQHRDHVVFILWGSFARRKAGQIDLSKHAILEGPHPSPLSAHRGFFGSKPFSQTNAILRGWGQAEIDWRL
jgi:uracil-DNA glycosylase